MADEHIPQLSVTKETVEKLLSKVPDGCELSFELIVGSLFPTSYDAIKEIYTQGYITGFNEAQKSK